MSETRDREEAEPKRNGLNVCIGPSEYSGRRAISYGRSSNSPLLTVATWIGTARIAYGGSQVQNCSGRVLLTKYTEYKYVS
jgi:hypothetical protein